MQLREHPERPLIRPHMPELDTARGIAILLVLSLHGLHEPLVHLAPKHGFSAVLMRVTQFGWVGVNLFFVLSGFLITGILLDTRSRPDYFRRFYLRRARRILPALYMTLAILLLAHGISWRFAAVSGFFLANCAPLMAVPLQYPPLWSLAVEEHFYLLWPSLVRRLPDRVLVPILVGVCLATPLLRALFLPRAAELSVYLTWFNLDGLAIGALLAMWLRSPSCHRQTVRLLSVTTFLLGVCCFALAVRYAPTLEAPASNITSLALISGMLLVGTSRWSSLIEFRFLRFCGYVSYGLYLLHLLIFGAFEALSMPLVHELQSLDYSPTSIRTLRFLVGSALAIGVAYLSRRSLEEFFLRTSKRQTFSSDLTPSPESVK